MSRIDNRTDLLGIGIYSIMLVLILSACTGNGKSSLNVQTTSKASGREGGLSDRTSIESAPAAPTDTGAFAKVNFVTFSWPAVTNADSYNIRVGTSEGAADLYSGNVGNVLSYSQANVPNGATVFAMIQAANSAGKTSPWSPASDGITIDLSLTSGVISVTTSHTANGADVRTSPSTSFFVNFTGAADSGSGLASYTIITYPQASCAGVPTITNGISSTATSSLVTGTNGTTYSFKVTASDAAGNILTSTCSNSIKVDTQPPPNLAAFTGAAGQIDSYIDLSLQFPNDVSDYASVNIRRAAGATAPADCSSGTLIATVGSFTNQTVSDNTGSPGTVFSYRLCATDATGNVNSSQVIENVTSKVREHTIFVTSGIVNGGIGGLTSADNYCQTAATNAGLSGIFKAILSNQNTDANSRILIKGPVKLVNGTVVAANRTSFWSGTLSAAINYDEFGVAGSGSTLVMTGSTPSGGKFSTWSSNDCSNYTSTAGGSAFFHYGLRAALDSTAIDSGNANCWGDAHLYCMSVYTASPLTAFNATTGATTNGDVDLSWTYPASTSGFARLDIRRASGATVPADCSSGTLITSITNTATTTYTDATGGPGLRYSYLGCVYDTDGDFVSSHPAAGTYSKGNYYRGFITSSTYDGVLGGLVGADAKCQARASAAGLTGTWLAFLSTSTIDARDRFFIDGPLYSLNGALIANDEIDFLDGTIANPFNTDELGGAAGGWFNGTSNSGVASGGNCADWTSNSSGIGIVYGNTSGTTLMCPSGCISNCSQNQRILCLSGTYYPPIVALSGSSGTVSGSVDLTITFPADTSLYHRVDIRRNSGSTVPNKDCTSDGTVAVTMSSGFINKTVTDSTAGSPGSTFSYRACVYDAQNRLVDSLMSTTNVHSNGSWHRIFVTSMTYTGNLGGLAGADAYCAAAATAGSLSGTFKALLSTSSVDMRDRIAISGPVFNTAGQLVATSQADFYDGSHAATIAYDEFGISAGLITVWTASYTNGTKKGGYCADWTSTGGSAAEYAYRDQSGSNALEANYIGGPSACASSLKLYCLSQ